jgi:hypothetical protein
MKYLRRVELTEPGYYWWLPEYLEDQPEDPKNWTIVSWHPADDRIERCGVFHGPIPAPTYKVISS